MNRASPSLMFSAMLLLAACQPADKPATPAAAAEVPAKVAPQAEKPAAKPAVPRLVVETFSGGQFDLQSHRGKWVVVNFWATWCNPCLKEIPELDAFDQARDDVEVIGLAYEEIERQDMLAFLKEHPISYPIAVLDVYDPPADFETPKGLPMTYLIAPDGKVVKQFLGPITSAELAKIIDAGAPAPAAAT